MRLSPTPELASSHRLVGESLAMRRLRALVARAAASDATALVTGEPGTGKELVARALHEDGPRRAGPFVAVSCSALHENLAESELFGHVKGAFTGAHRDHPGVFVLADHGTLLLDEIGDLSPSLQAKLLRVLAAGEVTPVGGVRPQPVDVRIVASTFRDLRALVVQRRFREDLCHRLDVLRIPVPSLRERAEDVPAICEHVLAESARRAGLQPKRLSSELLDALRRRDWPGNVRELRNEIERLSVLSGDAPVLEADALAPGLRRPRGGTLAEAVRCLEHQMLTEGLAASGGNRSELARLLGVSRTTLLKKLRDHGLAKGGRPRSPELV